MNESNTLHIVTGAPGSGKTTTAETLLTMTHPYLIFDIDWLAPAASGLAGKEIQTHPETWEPFGQLWFDVLHMIFQNGQVPVFFCPNIPADFEHSSRPAWLEKTVWILIDCSDQERVKRLKERSGWTEARIEEALADAAEMRGIFENVIRSDDQSPAEVSARILEWLEGTTPV